MKNIKTLKKVCAVTLVVCLVCGMIPVIGAIWRSSVAEAETAEKFVADFSELGTLLQGATLKDSLDNTHHETAYTPISDTITVDGKINTWMREHFASTTNHKYSTTRAWFAQKSDEISDAEADGWGKNGKLTGFALMSDGNLRLRVVNASGANMMRRVDTLIPQFNGENVQLKNFKMTIKYRTFLQDYRGAMTVAFDEAKAGSVVGEPNTYGEIGYRKRVTGSTLVIGNGTGMEQSVGNDGWIFYNKKDLISATTVDEQHFSDPSIAWRELKPGSDYTMANGDVVYERFASGRTQQWITLTVEVKSGKASFTLVSEDGTYNETMEMAYEPYGGYVSIGLSNRDYVISYVDIEEYDDTGDAVDFGTYHNKKTYGVDSAVEVFSADFTDLPDINYVSGNYLYNKTHDTATGKGVGLTAIESNTASSVGEFAAGYAVNVKDKALVDYLESKFNFFTYANGGGGTFEQWNAAGYVVDAQGNPLSAGWKANSGTAYKPATGVAEGDYMPGSGLGGYWYGGMYPTQNLSENKWLHIASDIGINAMNPFDVVYSFSLQDSNGNKAVVKNFKLDLDFKLTHPGYPSYAHNQSPVFVKFAGYDTVRNDCKDGAMFSISHNGGYFLDDLSTGFTSSKNSDNSPAYTEYIGGAAATQKVGEAHLTLTVKHGTVNAVVTLADGTKVLDVTKSDINIQNGQIYIGTSYAGMNHGLPYFGAVQVVRLDDEGNPIDFTNGSNEKFEASFVGLTDVVDGKYYRNNGNKDKALLLGKVPTENVWLSDATAVESGYAFAAEDANIVNYLNENFDFYHTDLVGKVHTMPTPFTNTEELQADKWAPTAGRWVLYNGNRLRASLDVASGELFRKSLTLAPKMNGKAINVVDFEMEFDYSIESARNGIYYPGAVALSFRSPEMAKTTTSAGGYADAVTLVFTREKMVLYDNTAADYNYADVQSDEGGLAWNGGNTDVSAAHVSLKVVGGTMSLKVTSLSDDTVYYANENIALSRLYDGYVYLTALNSDVAFGDISITPLYAKNYAATPENLTMSANRILGLDARYAYEYKRQDAEEWTAVALGSTEIDGVDMSVSYQVRLAATDSHDAGAAVTLEMVSYDRSNTVVYNLENASQMNDFDTWFVPTLTYGNTAIKTTGAANTGWYLQEGALRYNGSAYWKEPTAYHSGVNIEGQNWKCSYASVYNSNMAVAVLKNKQYKNFILDFDFTGSYYWTTVGFGAKNTADGVFWNMLNGGYSLFLESSGDNTGSADFYYMTADGVQKTQNAAKCFDYVPSGQHHMRVTVTDGKAYMTVDDQKTWVVDIPAEYTGGYIYFALNNTTTAIDNIQIVDLDVKDIVITGLAQPLEMVEIDRAAGETVNDLPDVAYGTTADGFKYPLLVDFEIGEDYRSYKDTTFFFNMALKPMKNVSLANSFYATLSVVNKVDYDTAVSRKYYFDHANDLKDFNGYYSKPEYAEGYWTNANDTGTDEEKNRKWSAYDGDLVKIDDSSRSWVVSANTLTTNYWGGNTNASAVMYMRNLSTLMYKDHTFMNFRMEYDVKKGANSWWYNYSIIGVQDPDRDGNLEMMPYMYQLHTYNASLSTGENTANKSYEGTQYAGVYAFLEQEGYFNLFGNIEGGKDRVATDAVTTDGVEYDFIKTYDKDAWHHITIEVVDGIMKWTVDDSFTLYYELDYNAYGGFVGLGTYGTYSQFDNFQITALDANGNAVDMNTAEQGWAKSKTNITKPDAWLPSFKFNWG